MLIWDWNILGSSESIHIWSNCDWPGHTPPSQRSRPGRRTWGCRRRRVGRGAPAPCRPKWMYWIKFEIINHNMWSSIYKNLKAQWFKYDKSETLAWRRVMKRLWSPAKCRTNLNMRRIRITLWQKKDHIIKLQGDPSGYSRCFVNIKIKVLCMNLINL